MQFHSRRLSSHSLAYSVYFLLDASQNSSVCYYISIQGDIVHKSEMVGAFQKIPMVMPATDILMSAQRKSRNVPPTKGILPSVALYSSIFL
jgi:nucleolar GTP-binding protein